MVCSEFTAQLPFLLCWGHCECTEAGTEMAARQAALSAGASAQEVSVWWPWIARSHFLILISERRDP